MRYSIVAILFLFYFSFLPSVFSQENPKSKKSGENITITTYYPAPFGSYRTLRLAPSEPVENPQEGDIYYDSQEYTLKYFTNGYWGGVIWFGRAGIFLKEGAIAMGRGTAYGEYTIEGWAKYEGGKIYTRSLLRLVSGKEACDSGWTQSFDAECDFHKTTVRARANVYGVEIYLKSDTHDISWPLHPDSFSKHEFITQVKPGQGYWR